MTGKKRNEHEPPPPSRAIYAFIHRQQRPRIPLLIEQPAITNILIIIAQLIPSVPEYSVHEPAVLCKLVDILHELARGVPTEGAACVPRRHFSDPDGFVAVFGVEGVDVIDDFF